MILKFIPATFILALFFSSCNSVKNAADNPQTGAIEGEPAENVSPKDGNPGVEDKRWKLVELYGKPVTGSAEAYYIIFHSQDGRVEAKANCNVINNHYKISNQYQLKITPGTTTMMACTDDLEKELIKAMAEADNLSISETNLTLNKARMSPLARFELAANP